MLSTNAMLSHACENHCPKMAPKVSLHDWVDKEFLQSLRDDSEENLTIGFPMFRTSRNWLQLSVLT